MMFLQSVLLAMGIMLGIAIIVYIISMMKWISKDYPQEWKKIKGWITVFCCVTVLIHIIRLILS